MLLAVEPALSLLCIFRLRGPTSGIVFPLGADLSEGRGSKRDRSTDADRCCKEVSGQKTTVYGCPRGLTEDLIEHFSHFKDATS